MPKIYEYFGLIFLFHSEDHMPIHVHARYGEFENKFEYIYKNGKLINILIKSVRGKKNLPPSVMGDAERFAKMKEPEIAAKWVEFYNKNKKPSFERITKKI